MPNTPRDRLARTYRETDLLRWTVANPAAVRLAFLISRAVLAERIRRAVALESS